MVTNYQTSTMLRPRALRGLGGLSRDSFFAEMGNIDRAIARAIGIPEQMATSNGNVFNDAIDRARAAGKFRSADNSDKKKDYTSSLKRYIDTAAPSILRDMNRVDLIPMLIYEKPYFKSFQPAPNVPSTTNTGTNPGSSEIPATPNTGEPNGVSSSDSTKKYALIVGGVVAAVGIGVFLFKRKKK